ncbi:4046_t:CDS:2, partial [Gigaspora margarita]
NTLSLSEFDRLWDSLLEQYPGAQSTQKVEGQNAIIKSTINSNTSILEFVKKIDIQFNRVSTTIQYQNWSHSVTSSMLIHSSYDFSPIIDKWIIDYLMPAALFMQRQEIAQAVWYSSQLVDKNHTFETEDKVESFNTSFAEDNIDQAFTNGFQESFEATLNIKSYLKILFNIGNISYERVHKSLNQRKEYVVANGLSKKVIQMELDAGLSAIQELNNFMKEFITKHAPKPNQKLAQKKSKRTLSAISQNIQNCDSDNFDDNNSNNSNDLGDSNNPGDSNDPADSDNFNDSNSNYDDNIENIDPSLIQNPIVCAKKGAPRKTRFKGSYETNQKI